MTPNNRYFCPKLRTGFLGGVTWIFDSKEVKQECMELGLPSSEIDNTAIAKASKFAAREKLYTLSQFF